MTRYNRPNGKLFGSSASNIGVFGSGQGRLGETPTTSTDPNAINTLSTHWEEGWDGAVVSQAPYTAPFVEDMNAVNYVNSYNSAYLLQKGIPEYSKTADYYEDSVCTYNGNIYICIQDNPAVNSDPDDPDPDAPLINYDPTDTNYWNERVELPDMHDNEILVGDTGNGATVTGTLNQGDILASTSGLDIKAGVVTNTHISSQAGDKIAESKLDLAYTTSTLNTNIGNVSNDLSTHTNDSNNPHSTTLANLVGNNLSTPNDQDTLVYDGNSSKWINQENSLDNLSNATITTPSNKDVLWYSGGSWVNTPDVNNHMVNKNNPHETEISNLHDVNASTPNDQDTLVYDSNSSKWINQPNTVENLQNTNISAISNGQILSYDSGNSEWVNTTNSIDNLSDTTITSATSGDALIFDGNDWINQENSVDNLSDTTITSATSGDALIFDGNDWINQENSVENLSDVNVSGVADGDILVYDANSSTWINSQGGGGGGGDLGYKNLTGFPVVQYKKYFGVSSYNTYWNFTGGSYNLATQTNVTWVSSKSVNTSPLSSSTDYYFMYSASHGTIEAIKLSDCIVSSTAPTFNQATCWFNTTTKVFKYGKGASDWDTTSYDDLCVPLCMYRDGKLTHIYNEIASSFLNYLFLYPNTKYLRPKGRNQNTGEYINDVEYLSGSSNLMKDIAVSTSTYSGLDFFVRNDSDGSSFTLLKKSAIYFCEEDMYYGKVIFPYNTSFTVGYSYSENAWATIWGSGTKFGDKQSYMGGGILATMDSSGIIRNIDTLDLYDRLVTKKFLNSVIEVYDIANINSATSNIILTSSDKRHQVFTATDGFNITLPSANIKAGEKVILEFTQNGAFTSNSMKVYVGSTFFEYAHIGNFSYIYTALVDNPSLTTDWMSQFRLRKPVVKYKLGGANASCPQNTRTLMTTSTLVTLFPGIWDIHYSMSTTAAGGVGSDNPWTSYLIISDTSPYTVLYDRASSDIIGFGVSVTMPRNRSVSISDTGTDSYDSWQATNFSKTAMINVLRRSENIKAQNSVYNTGATTTCYFTNNVFCNLVEPVRATNITG